jgi:hypothetical protein
MAQPNEMRRSDFIHWRLAEETDVEIRSWLDGHSRFLLSPHRAAQELLRNQNRQPAAGPAPPE